MTFALSVPANLLLLGEYAVTEEGGLGIALASAPRITIRAMASERPDGLEGPAWGEGPTWGEGSLVTREAEKKPSESTEGARGRPRLSIGGRMGPHSFNWVEGESEPPPLVASCVEVTRRFLHAMRAPAEALALAPSRVGAAASSRVGAVGAARIDIDSSAFFSPDGTKRGFGSSAAVAVGLCAALLRLGGLEDEALEAAIFPAALAAHRQAQGGRGSGYDVAASRYGGVGLFEGGASPKWTSLPPSLALALGGLDLTLHFGLQPVSSALAVASYQHWKTGAARANRAFLSASAARVRDFLTARTPEALLATLHDAADAGAAFGDAIGVPARPDPRLLSADFRTKQAAQKGAAQNEAAQKGAAPKNAPTEPLLQPFAVTMSPSPSVLKCLGAGDELILLASLDDSGTRSAAAAETGAVDPAALDGRGCEADPAGRLGRKDTAWRADQAGKAPVAAHDGDPTLSATDGLHVKIENEGLRWE